MPNEQMTDERLREIFLTNGFTVKPGEPDLKPYVFAAGRMGAEPAQPAAPAQQANCLQEDGA